MRLLCYPKRPNRGHKLQHICRSLGWEFISQPNRDHDAAIVWLDSTWVEDDAVIRRLRSGTKPCLNANCLDISKSRVDAVMRSVFGYGISVDPLTYMGEMVAKREENDRKSALKLVAGPLEPEQVEPGTVYQRLIDTHLEDGRIQDLRVCIFSGKPRFTVLKQRDDSDRFDPEQGSSVVVDETAELFADEDVQLIARFCAEMGLDYGELDVLRDQDGRLFVVDCNKTPGTGMVYPATEEEAPERRRVYETAFREMFGDLDRRLEVRCKSLLRRWRRRLLQQPPIGDPRARSVPPSGRERNDRIAGSS